MTSYSSAPSPTADKFLVARIVPQVPVSQLLHGTASFMAEGRVTTGLQLRALPAQDAILPEAVRRELCK